MKRKSCAKKECKNRRFHFQNSLLQAKCFELGLHVLAEALLLIALSNLHGVSQVPGPMGLHVNISDIYKKLKKNE